MDSNFFKVHKPKLWKEVRTVISGVDAEACKTKVSKEKRIVATCSMPEGDEQAVL